VVEGIPSRLRGFMDRRRATRRPIYLEANEQVVKIPGSAWEDLLADEEQLDLLVRNMGGEVRLWRKRPPRTLWGRRRQIEYIFASYADPAESSR
jgi:hypothetical protein